MRNPQIPGTAILTLETENTFIAEMLKGLAIMPTLIIEFRYDWDGEYGAPCTHEFSCTFDIKNKKDYSNDVHDCILDLLDSKEDDFIQTFLDELWSCWYEYATDYVDAQIEYRSQYGY
jgi:hypothetical protein